LTFIIASIALLLMLSGCGNSDNAKTVEKELELHKKELELKQKELELKEEEISQNKDMGGEKQNPTSVVSTATSNRPQEDEGSSKTPEKMVAFKTKNWYSSQHQYLLKNRE
jgi:hypothetical protein